MKKASRTLSARIHTISGQLTAVEKMLMHKRSCTEVLNQISAIRAGLEEVAGLVFQKELERRLRRRSLSSHELQLLTTSFRKTT
ncbi:MAG: metal-sensitive transcriptional regulator [Candidatus Kerfeldbacteria bacterium]|nr:metal-sensitive transcriptional regulator [Candidatus Kerfeldbacteria bacterium]